MFLQVMGIQGRSERRRAVTGKAALATGRFLGGLRAR